MGLEEGGTRDGTEEEKCPSFIFQKSVKITPGPAGFAVGELNESAHPANRICQRISSQTDSMHTHTCSYVNCSSVDILLQMNLEPVYM